MPPVSLSTSSTPNVTSLKAVSVSYSPVQDRLLLSVDSTDDRHIHLWLTQRLVALIRGHIENWLKKQGEGRGDSSPGDARHSGSQSSADKKAVKTQQRTPEVDVLVTHVDFATVGIGLQMTFKNSQSPSEGSYCLRLQSPALNRWWSGILDTCALGDWALTEPKTGASDKITAKSSVPRILH